MAGVVLENISTKKLVGICLVLITLQLACFIMGGVMVPQPVHYQTVSGSLCPDKDHTRAIKWLEGSSCAPLDSFEDKRIEIEMIEARHIVFSFKYPLPRDDTELKMSRWFMYHVAVLSFDVLYNTRNQPANKAPLAIQVQVGYRENNNSQWMLLYEPTTVVRHLVCREPEQLKEKYRYDCDVMDLFEIGNMHHEQYLINLRLPPNFDTNHNIDIGQLDGINLVWFAQTGGFTLYFLVMKTVFFAILLPLTIWSWKRVVDLQRKSSFLERLLLSLAFSAILLNIPVDWFVLVIKMPFMLLWSDIRQGVFLFILLSFWLIFTGEHMMDDVQRGEWTSYWKQLAAVMLASLLMFVFDLCERGMRIVNPFFSIWSTQAGTNLALAFIGIAIASGCVYFVILLSFIIKAMLNIWRKRSLLHKLAKDLQVHHTSILYRFYFMLIFTILCCLLTVISFILGQFYESRWRWDNQGDEDTSGIHFEINSAFQLGVYGTWNVYVIAMLIFYAPSHKAPAAAINVDDGQDETVELTAVPSARVHRRANKPTSEQQEVDEATQLTTEFVSEPSSSQMHTLGSSKAFGSRVLYVASKGDTD